MKPILLEVIIEVEAVLLSFSWTGAFFIRVSDSVKYNTYEDVLSVGI
ncbi:MAG: hypothetical protein P8H65_03400 [Rhodothermales bacterium]|nr:hypothetical protein [Rhodothermales bacterium]MDG2015900.1 hypothetical protein [Rhodothermales bacterium]